MKCFARYLALIFFGVLLSYQMPLYAAQQFDPNSPVGFWKTIDDVTGKPKSIVEIASAPDHTVYGKVAKLFEGAIKICTKCTGSKHNQPVLGMTVITGLKQNKEDKSEWIDGSALDPKNGKTYHAKLRIIDNGQKLILRGFIGIPLFGRSQTWERVTTP